MLDGFDLAGCVRVEIVRCGFVRASEVSLVTLRLHYADGPPEERVVDFEAYGVNYETLVRLVRQVNVRLPG